jgi:hypothetical protein
VFEPAVPLEPDWSVVAVEPASPAAPDPGSALDEAVRRFRIDRSNAAGDRHDNGGPAPSTPAAPSVPVAPSVPSTPVAPSVPSGGSGRSSGKGSGAGDRTGPGAATGTDGPVTERRPLGGLAAAPRGRSALDRLNFSDMADADRLALGRRRGGGVPLRRRDNADEPDHVDAGTGVDAGPAADQQRQQPSGGQPARPFAGLADQVRAAGSGQIPAARTPAPAEQPAAPDDVVKP